MRGLSVIFPAKDELSSLVVVIPFLFFASPSSREVIVVLDSLEDDTWSLSKHVFFDTRPIKILLNEGQGVLGAIETGVRHSEFEHSIICAADEYLPVLKIEEFYRKLISGFDFVSGTRYANGGKRFGGNLIEKVFSKFANKVLSSIFQVGLTDFTTGIKAFRNSIFHELMDGANPVGWSCSLTFTLNAIKKKINLSEVPIVSVDRVLGGSSKLNLKKWIVGYLNVIFNFYSVKNQEIADNEIH